MPPPRKYLPLLRYLAAVPPEQQTVTLTFAELEALLGAALPPSRWLPHYWAGSSLARTNWASIGFTAKLDRLDRTVSFTRQAPDVRGPRRVATQDYESHN